MKCNKQRRKFEYPFKRKLLQVLAFAKMDDKNAGISDKIEFLLRGRFNDHRIGSSILYNSLGVIWCNLATFC